MKAMIVCVSLVLGAVAGGVGCGDDTDKDDDVKVDAPGVDVKVDKLEAAAGSSAD